MTASSRTTGPAPCTWWSDRWAWRGAIGAAPFGALTAILYALIVLRLAPTAALLAFLLGAALAGGIACLLAGSLGASVETVRYRLRVAAEERDDEIHGDDEDDVDDDVRHPPVHARRPAADARDAQAVA